MRIMWICNIPILNINRKNESKSFGGWMSAMANILSSQKSIELLICYPQNEISRLQRQRYKGISFYGFYVKNRTFYDEVVYKQLKKIEGEFVPDIIHLFGTEFPHSLSAIKLDAGKTLVDIQGLIGVYAYHYFTGVSINGSFGHKDSFAYNEMKELKKRGKYEKEVLKQARYITGRTSWDYACVKAINKKAKYFPCNRILRGSFYEHDWNYKNCEKYSILVSQADYPVKGFHIFLKALNILQKKYKDIKVVVAGTKLNLETPQFGTYDYYIKELIMHFHQEKIIEFVGLQDEYQMCNRYLRANVFVLPSVIENSPNSLGEAMIMGVPCVASYVGGVSSYIEHEVNGFLYQADAYYMLAYYIGKIFDEMHIVERYSGNAKKKAMQIYNKDINMQNLINIYSSIIKNNES